MEYKLLKNTNCIVFDLDGTIYFGSELAPNANELINIARAQCQKIFFVTNNSAKTRRQIFEKLVKLGVSVSFEEVITSGCVIADYLKTKDYKQIYCLGTDELAAEIEEKGIISKSKNPQAIVIGYDINFNLMKLEEALNVYNKDCEIIVANKERTYPRENGIVTPGAGAIVSAFEYTINRKSDLVIGKPNPLMLEIITKDLNISPQEVLVIGDSYESDVAMADNFGAKSILIRNGNEKEYNCKSVNLLKDILELI